MSFNLQGRTAVVFGVANKRSIAWSIAQGLHNAGATLAVTCQNERLEQEAKDLIVSHPGAEGFMCDVSDDGAVDRLFSKLKEQYGKLHVLVHSVAFAPAEELKGPDVISPEPRRVQPLLGKALGSPRNIAAPEPEQLLHAMRQKKEPSRGTHQRPAVGLESRIDAPESGDDVTRPVHALVSHFSSSRAVNPILPHLRDLLITIA